MCNPSFSPSTMLSLTNCLFSSQLSLTLSLVYFAAQTHPQNQKSFSTEVTQPFLLSSLMSHLLISLTQLSCTQAPMERVHTYIIVSVFFLPGSPLSTISYPFWFVLLFYITRLKIVSFAIFLTSDTQKKCVSSWIIMSLVLEICICMIMFTYFICPLQFYMRLYS